MIRIHRKHYFRSVTIEEIRNGYLIVYSGADGHGPFTLKRSVRYLKDIPIAIHRIFHDLDEFERKETAM
jgi:hypothetical protein